MRQYQRDAWPARGSTGGGDTCSARLPIVPPVEPQVPLASVLCDGHTGCGPHGIPNTRAATGARKPTGATPARARMQEALEALRIEFDQHAITQQLAPQVLEDWQGWATEQVKALQRSSSAVAGRNGCLSGMHHTQRGCPKNALRCGRWCITSIVALRMGRRQRLVFSAAPFLIFLKPCWPRWVNCLDLVGELARWGKALKL